MSMHKINDRLLTSYADNIERRGQWLMMIVRGSWELPIRTTDTTIIIVFFVLYDLYSYFSSGG